MTGRDLIIYIMQNHLEDEVIFSDGKIVGFLTIEEAAVKYKVGIETIKAYVSIGYLPGLNIGDTIYIPANAKLTKK